MIKGKRIAIYGFGKEGVSAANFLGQNNDVSIIDDKTKKEIDPIFFSKGNFTPSGNCSTGIDDSGFRANPFSNFVFNKGKMSTA